MEFCGYRLSIPRRLRSPLVGEVLPASTIPMSPSCVPRAVAHAGLGDARALQVRSAGPRQKQADVAQILEGTDLLALTVS